MNKRPSTRNIIADSSFFLLFLNDIDRPSYLDKLIKNYKFIITQMIKEELSGNSKSNTWLQSNSASIVVEDINEYRLEEIFSSLVSKKAISIKLHRGEWEIIGLAYMLKDEGEDFILIIDDKEARRFVEKNMPSLQHHLCYTLKFIELCTCNEHIFKKEEALDMLEEIERRGRFRVTGDILAQIKNNIERW
jgi:predicted nucleic acid-binding protein